MKNTINSFEINKAITFSKLFSKVKLKPASRLVLRCLIDFWNNKIGYAFPKQSTIAECTGLTRASVITAIEELRAQHLIETRQHQYLLYYFLSKKLLQLLGVSCQANLHHMYKKMTPASKESIHITNNNNKLLNKEEIFKNEKDIKAHTERICSPYDDYECAINWLKSLDATSLKLRVIKERRDKVISLWDIDENTLIIKEK